LEEKQTTNRGLKTMINLNDYENWQDYFKTIFKTTKKYERIEEGIMGQTIIEKYVPFDKNDKTEIKVGYLDETLLYWKFENPLTKGYNKQQEIEYFYRYDFTPGQSYGEPGIEFIDINIQAIDKQLREGLKGKEVQYFKDGQLIKSKIFIYYNGNQQKYPNTIYFAKTSAWQKLLDIFFKPKEVEIQTKEIDLSAIFGGLK
jgi:hypothetical protein